MHFVGCLVVAILHFATGFWWDAGSDSARCRLGAVSVVAIALVAQKFLGVGYASNGIKAPLWPLIWPSVSLITMTRPSRSQTARSLELKQHFVRGRAPLFKRLAAVRWA